MPSKRIRDLPAGTVTAGHLVPVDDPAGVTYRVPLGQAGGLPFLNALGKLNAPDAYLHRGLINFLGVDWNTITATGTYTTRDAGTGGANYPPAGNRWGVLVVSGDGSTYIVQIYFPHVNDAYVYYRVRFDTGWSPWRAAGSEYGSNASGFYVRFADGTQICWNRISFQVNGGTWNYSPLYSWPAAFAVPPMVTTSYDHPGWRFIYSIDRLSSTSYGFAVYNFDSTVTLYALHVVAIGRWK